MGGATLQARFACLLALVADLLPLCQQAWNNLRTVCDFNPNVGVCLEITADLPSDDVLAKWLGEPVRVRATVVAAH